MPVIVAQIGGNAVQYTWVITAGILANTITTPIIGKLSDLFDKKKLFIISLVLFMTASLLSGASQTANQLIAARVLQGIGMGMMITLTTVIMATIVSPRERGKYNGYMAASMAVSTVGGPLIGGLIVDTIGWRWCFWVPVPFVVVVMFVVASHLKVPSVHEGKAHIDFLGIALIGAAAASLLIWISSEGRDFSVGSPISIALISLFVASTILFVFVESRAKEPLIPLYLFRNRTIVLSIVAFIAQGMAQFSMSVFLGQYFQYGRSYTPTASGLMTLPLMLTMMAASTIIGRRTTATGYWKRYVTAGLAAMVVGLLMFWPVDGTTSLIYIGVSMAILGGGMGAMNTLMVAVQNLVGLKIMGATTSTVMFFRTLSGALGIQLLGRVYQAHVKDDIVAELGAMPDTSSGSGELDFAALPDSVETVVRTAYGEELGMVFLVIAGFTLAGLIAVSFIKGTSLRSSIDVVQVKEILKQEDDIVDGTSHNITEGVSLGNARTAQEFTASSEDVSSQEDSPEDVSSGGMSSADDIKNDDEPSDS